MNLTLTIGGVDKTTSILRNTFALTNALGQRDTFQVTVKSDDGSYAPAPGAQVKVDDDDLGNLFGGTARSGKISKFGIGCVTQIGCASWEQLFDRRRVGKISYEDVAAGDIIADLFLRFMGAEDISASILETGPNITIAFDFCTMREALDQICSLATGDTDTYMWDCRNRNLRFYNQSTFPAPFDCTMDTAKLPVDISWDFSDYGNKAFVRVPQLVTDPRTQVFDGDGAKTTFTCDLPLAAAPTIERITRTPDIDSDTYSFLTDGSPSYFLPLPIYSLTSVMDGATDVTSRFTYTPGSNELVDTTPDVKTLLDVAYDFDTGTSSPTTLSQTVGIQGVDTGKDWYWSAGSADVVQDAGGTLLGLGEKLSIEGEGLLDDVVDAGQDEDAVAERQAAEGGSGWYMVLLEAQQSGMRAADAVALGQAWLAAHAKLPFVVEYKTDLPGLRAGMSQRIALSKPGPSFDDTYILESVRTVQENGTYFFYVRGVNGALGAGWLQKLRTIANQGTGTTGIVNSQTVKGSRTITADDTQLTSDDTVLFDTSSPTVAPTTTTLAAAITTTAQTAISLTAACGPNGTYFEVDDGVNVERLYVVSGGGTTSATVTRGASPHTFASGAGVNLPGHITFTLQQISAVRQKSLVGHKISGDINYVVVLCAGSDTFPGGATSVILPDNSADRGTFHILAPGEGTVWIQLGGAGAAGPPGGGGTPASLTLTFAGSTGQVGAAYSGALIAVGGVPPFAFDISVGSLPAGLSLDAGTGAITGTPTAAGSTTFTARVIDGASTPATVACEVVINPPQYESQGANLLVNASAENGTTGWTLGSGSTITTSTTAHRNGAASFRIPSASSGFKSIYQELAASPGQVFTAGVWGLSDTVAGGAVILAVTFYDSGGSLLLDNTVAAAAPGTSAWLFIGGQSQQAPASTAKARITLRMVLLNSSANIYADDVFAALTSQLASPLTIDEVTHQITVLNKGISTAYIGDAAVAAAKTSLAAINASTGALAAAAAITNLQRSSSYYISAIPTIAAGGTGYVLGDVLSLSGGTHTTTATVTVTAVSSGAVTAVSVTQPGVYSATPSNPVSTTGGTGTGCTLTVTWGGGALAVNNGINVFTDAMYLARGTTEPVVALLNTGIFFYGVSGSGQTGDNTAPYVAIQSTGVLLARSATGAAVYLDSSTGSINLYSSLSGGTANPYFVFNATHGKMVNGNFTFELTAAQAKFDYTNGGTNTNLTLDSTGVTAQFGSYSTRVLSTEVIIASPAGTMELTGSQLKLTAGSYTLTQDASSITLSNGTNSLALTASHVLLTAGATSQLELTATSLALIAGNSLARITLDNTGTAEFKEPTGTVTSITGSTIITGLVLALGGLSTTGSVTIGSPVAIHTYDSRLVFSSSPAGTTHLWVDSAGKLRIKTGAPTSDTDGTVVGTQT